MQNVEDAWFFLHSLFELIWQYRFLYRDLNDLLSKNRRLETHLKSVLIHKTEAFKSMLQGMSRAGALQMDGSSVDTTAQCMVVVLSYWLSFEYVQNPRSALEPDRGQAALVRGALHVLNLLLPYLEPDQRLHLRTLAQAYQAQTEQA